LVNFVFFWRCLLHFCRARRFFHPKIFHGIGYKMALVIFMKAGTVGGGVAAVLYFRKSFIYVENWKCTKNNHQNWIFPGLIAGNWHFFHLFHHRNLGQGIRFKILLCIKLLWQVFNKVCIPLRAIIKNSYINNNIYSDYTSFA